MGLITLQSDKINVTITDFRTSNMEVKVSNMNIRITQFEYDSTQIL